MSIFEVASSMLYTTRLPVFVVIMADSTSGCYSTLTNDVCASLLFPRRLGVKQGSWPLTHQRVLLVTNPLIGGALSTAKVDPPRLARLNAFMGSFFNLRSRPDSFTVSATSIATKASKRRYYDYTPQVLSLMKWPSPL